MANEKIKKRENIFTKERRLKARKQTYKETYKKGFFYVAYQRLQEYIGQPDVLVRCHASGQLDDGIAFIQITVEGFTPSKDGI